MPLISPAPFRHLNLSFFCDSIAGIYTSICIPELDLAFDAGLAFPYLEPINNYFISHGHMDHLSGLPHLISLKSLNKLKPPNIYLPLAIQKPFIQLMNAWEQLEGIKHHYNLHPLTENQIVSLSPRHEVKCFTTEHRIPSLGYTIFEKRKKLKTEFNQLASAEIINLKKQGVQVETEYSFPLVSYSGDTRLDAMLKHDWIKQSKVLIIETTYLDQTKTVEHAHNWGHIHLDELLPHLNQFSCEKILLIHVSARYGGKDITELVTKKIPHGLRDQVVVMSDLFNQRPKI